MFHIKNYYWTNLRLNFEKQKRISIFVLEEKRVVITAHYIHSSIALESPPRNRNELKEYTIEFVPLWAQTCPLCVRLVVSLRALARPALSFLLVKRRESKANV